MLVVSTCREAPNSDDASYQIFLDMDGQPRTLKVLSQLLEKERNTLDGVLKGKEKVLICLKPWWFYWYKFCFTASYYAEE